MLWAGSWNLRRLGENSSRASGTVIAEPCSRVPGQGVRPVLVLCIHGAGACCATPPSYGQRLGPPASDPPPSPSPASSSLRRADLSSLPQACLLPRDGASACCLPFCAQEPCLRAVLGSCLHRLTWRRPTLGPHPRLASGLGRRHTHRGREREREKDRAWEVCSAQSRGWGRSRVGRGAVGG